MRVNVTVAAMAVAEALTVLALAGCGGGSAHENSTDGLSAAAPAERRHATAATSNITVRARSSLAGNAGPLMTVRLNGTAVGTVEVLATDYQDYGFQVSAVPAGAKVDVVFNNDAMVNGQDRNLFVASITASGTTIDSTAASVTYDRGAGAQAFDGLDVLPGQRSMLWNGALRFTVSPDSYVVQPQELIQNGQFANGLTSWAVEDATLVKSELRSGGEALNVGWKATQRFASTALLPGRSYTLIVRARNDRRTGSSTLSVRFKRPQYSEVFRDYNVTVASASYQDYRVEFTAPVYAAMADFVISANGARVIIDSTSLKMRSAIPQTEPIASSEGSHVPAGYTLAFNDEFNGTTLNRAKWFTRYIYAGGTQDTLNDEKQRYRDNGNHVVADGVLSLVAKKVSSTEPNGMNYESGMVRSDWTSHYGYYEVRVKMPGGLGVAPAFWLNSDVSAMGRLGWPPEIDIFEFVHNGVEDRLNMLHFDVVKQAGAGSTVLYAHPAFSTNVGSYFAPYRFNEGWHTIGAQWDATTVTLFVDGLKICTRTYQWNYDDGTLAGPAHILLNFAVGGEWAGRHGIDDTAFPQAMQIDWVRAYRRNN